MACTPDCPRMKTGNNTESHCGNCHQTFAGITAFDAHFKRRPDGRVYCPPLEGDWWTDTKGIHHKGKPLTDEQKQQIWG